MKKLVVLACVVSLLVAAAVTAGCSSGGSSESSANTPQGVAKAFWTAALRADAAASWKMLSKRMQTGLKNESEWAKSVVVKNPSASVKVVKSTVTGDKAEVSVKIMSGSTEIMTQNVLLVKENGVWKVDLP